MAGGFRSNANEPPEFAADALQLYPEAFVEGAEQNDSEGPRGDVSTIRKEGRQEGRDRGVFWEEGVWLYREVVKEPRNENEEGCQVWF